MRRSRSAHAFPILLSLMPMVLSAPSLAQEEDALDEESEDEESEGEESEEDGDEEEEEEGDAPTDEAETSGRDADRETIFVVQSKPRLVAGSFEFAPQIAQSVNDKFTSHSGLILSGIYHLQENVAVELSLGGFFW
ncbi:MAG: hypothetical protein ACO3JL_09550, partial [Myxococcota bacterium]